MPIRDLANYGQYITLGAQIAASMIVPVIIGIYVDNRWNLSPWGVIIGALLGFGGLISIVLKLASKTGKIEYRDKSNKESGKNSESDQQGIGKI